MTQQNDTTIALFAGVDSGGQMVPFGGSFVTGLTVTNNSGLSIQYTTDGGGTWATVANGSSASPSVGEATSFRIRKMSSIGGPVSVGLRWKVSESVPAAEYPSARNLMRWRKALANVRTGQGRAKVACVGDSNTTGWGAGTSTNGLGGARAKSYPTYLAAILSGMGYATNTQSVWGTHNLDNGATIGTLLYGAYDTRVTYPADWASSNTSVINSVGGRLFRSPNTVTSSLIFTPSGSVDTFIVHVVKSTGNGTVTMNTDGGATAATIDCNASGAIASQTISVALGAHDVRVQRSTGGVIFVAGIEAYNSTAPAIDIWNMGGPGWGSSEWADATNAWSPKNALTYFDPDLSIINLGINNWKDTQQDIATYTANMQAVITAAQANGGSCVLVAPFPSQTTRAGVATQAQFIDVVYGLASINNCPLIDLTDRFSDWNLANTRGFAFNDLHPNSYGYADMAQSLVATLLD